jgi:hypothetical protein
MNQTQEINKVIDKIDKSQVGIVSNTIDMREQAQDPAHPVYNIHGSESDAVADQNQTGNPDIEMQEECTKFCSGHEIPESAKVTGQKSSGLDKVAAVDHI